MPSIVLRDAAKTDLGFLLIAGNDPLESSRERDVVLMSLPIPNESTLVQFIRSHKHTEFTAHIEASETGTRLNFQVSEELRVIVELEQAGTGSWSVSGVGRGLCMLVKP